LDEILKLDRERRDLLGELERLRSEQKQQSAGMAKSRQGGAPAADQAVIEELRKKREQIKDLEQRVGPIEARLNMLLLEVPNPPHESVPRGKDASDNVRSEERRVVKMGRG